MIFNSSDFDFFMNLISIMLLIFVPLGLWKLIEIIIWLFNHVSITM